MENRGRKKSDQTVQKHSVLIQIPLDVFSRLRYLADKEERSVNYFINKIIKSYLESLNSYSGSDKEL